MTGKNRKITVTKRFCQEVHLILLGTMRSVNILMQKRLRTELVTHKKEEMSMEDGNVNAANQIVRRTILPKNGSKDELYNQTQAVLYDVLFRKPFDFIEMMFREIEKNSH